MNGNWIIALAESAIATGQPGVGVSVLIDQSGISKVEFGPRDRVAPVPSSAQTIGSTVFPNRVELQWQGGSDGATGTGVWQYFIYRNGTLLGSTATPEFADATVAASTTYTYQVGLKDYHINSAGMSSFQITTPAAGSTDPRRVGVHGSGSYWGGGGEQIDMRSGSLNFTMPLISPQSRNGHGATFALNYNSQLWRKDTGGTWKLGSDVGFGFGWRFMAGSITPFWSSYYTIHHWRFVDATGAEYRLDTQNEYGHWYSRDNAYVWYDAANQRLYFPDGSLWLMANLTGNSEADAGTRYPTVIQDSNGNQIRVSYYGNTARIGSIQDVRGSYGFGYTAVNGTDHLTSITNTFGSSESYTLAYFSGQTLYSPFTPQVNYGTTALLQSVTRSGVGLTQSFEYGSLGSGELSKVSFPYGGDLRWEYRDFTYTSNRTLREVQYRKLTKQSGSPLVTYTIARDDAGDASRNTHAWATLDDAGGAGRKKWYFETNTASAYFGRETQFEDIALPSGTVVRRYNTTWTLDSVSRPYVGSVLTTLDPGQPYSKQSKVEQTFGKYGNVTQRKVYDYSSLTTPARTYTYTYLHSAQDYARTRYIVNRITNGTVSNGSQTLTTTTASYDACCVGNLSGVTLLDDGTVSGSNYFSPSMLFRGNPYIVTGYGSPQVTYQYYITGTHYSITSGGHATYVTPTANAAVPGSVTVGSLSETFSWNSFLGLTLDTKPNNAQSSIAYDSYARPTSTTSPHGATTTYTYTTSPGSTKATTNNKWVKTTYDGLGRAIKVETGNGGTTVSVVDTEYEPCACSPMGKVKRVSRPYAPGGTVYWTTYTYDALGRTISVVLPSGAGTTTYLYEGNTVTSTDPAGKWKKFTMDAMGNLTQVNEPNPAGGADLVTTYAYNAANQLTQVAMTRGGVTQYRTFNYTVGGKIASVVQPETGTTSYTYNADYTVATKIDAKNQKLAYTYDAYKRVTQIAKHPVSSGAEDVCQRVTFSYDSNPYDGAYSANIQGRLAAVRWGGTGCTAQGGQWTEMYSYSSGGLSLKKKLGVSRGVNEPALEGVYTYDNEGKMTAQSYPLGGGTYTYSFDSMGRPASLSDGTANVASGAAYNTASQLTSLTYGTGGTSWTESRTYNILGQMTRMTIPSIIDYEYTFSASANNGRITKYKDHITGEEVNYAYDSLNRLITASTTGPEWGLSFGYDGFGNKLSQTVTKGSAPSMSITVDGLTNRVVGQSYDANGNMLSAAGNTLTYDVDNRITTTAGLSSEWYGYAADNRRVWKKRQLTGSTFEENVYFYGITGQRIGTYTLTDTSGTLALAVKETNIYFGGKVLKQGSTWVAMDRLASVRYRSGSPGTRYDYWPYGEEKPTATTQDRDKFATYMRDHTNLDYAEQRYYANGLGRFVTPDPAGDGLNWYSYAGDDPVNNIDPTGLSVVANLLQGVDLGIGFSTSTSFTNLWGHSGFLMDPDGGFIPVGGGVGPADLEPSPAEMEYISRVQSVAMANALNEFAQFGPVSVDTENLLASVFPQAQVFSLTLHTVGGHSTTASLGDGGDWDGAGDAAKPDVPLSSNATLILSQVGQTTAPLSQPSTWAAWTGASILGGTAWASTTAFSYPGAGGFGLAIINPITGNQLIRFDWHRLHVFGKDNPLYLPHIDIDKFRVEHWPWQQVVDWFKTKP
jgi:RHS repeat-associated protein